MKETLVREIMTPAPITLSKHDTMLKARDLFKEYRVRHLPVKDDDTGDLIGILSSTDVESVKEGITLFKIKDREEHNRDLLEMTLVAYVMKKDVKCVAPSDNIREAFLIFKNYHFRCVPVIDRAKLVGIVSPIDIMEHFFKK